MRSSWAYADTDDPEIVGWKRLLYYCLGIQVKPAR
uniref:Uncharacterized protein n=1 Tax=Anguilla anguilla TaxID=7936 RepID=A0A0E9TW69_ANGAN